MEYIMENGLYYLKDSNGEKIGGWIEFEVQPDVKLSNSRYTKQSTLIPGKFAIVQNSDRTVDIIDDKGKFVKKNFNKDLITYTKFLDRNTFAVPEMDGTYQIYHITGNNGSYSLWEKDKVKDIPIYTYEQSHSNDGNFIIQSAENNKWYLAKIDNRGNLSKQGFGYENREDAYDVYNNIVEKNLDRKDAIYAQVKDGKIEEVIKACIDGKISSSELPDECFDGRYFNMLNDGFKKHYDSYLGQAQMHGATREDINNFIEKMQTESDYIRMRASLVRENSNQIIKDAKEEMDIF